jgi:hypothetical protein
MIPPSPGEIDETRGDMLKGKPLMSRTVWFMKRVAYVLVLVAALIVLLSLINGIWRVIGLTVLAFAAGMLPELFIDLRYGNYRKEWELANEEGARPDQLSPTQDG